jgi:hypothetical protein
MAFGSVESGWKDEERTRKELQRQTPAPSSRESSRLSQSYCFVLWCVFVCGVPSSIKHQEKTSAVMGNWVACLIHLDAASSPWTNPLCPLGSLDKADLGSPGESGKPLEKRNEEVMEEKTSRPCNHYTWMREV